VELKLLMAADAAAVIQIEQDLFGSDAWAERTVLSEIENPFTHYIGIFDGGLVGYAGLNSVPASFSADIQTIAVAAGSQGKGYGKLLLEWLMDRALQLGAEQVVLEVRADNDRAVSLYNKFGFEQIDLRKR